jgi:hypothetical protein
MLIRVERGDFILLVLKLNHGLYTLIITGLILLFSLFDESSAELSFSLSVAPVILEEPIDGRMLLLISESDKKEPRFLSGDSPESLLIFGIDVDSLYAGEQVLIDRNLLYTGCTACV